jgi:hypothetical protein
MAEIVQFRPRARYPADFTVSEYGDSDEEDGGIDLMTAIDAAIRDLRDIADRWGEEAARLQALECRLMLERAFRAAE